MPQPVRDPRRPTLKLRPPAETEAGVMRRILDWWQWRHVHALSTVHRYKRQTCARCGHNSWPSGGYGTSKGIGDLLIPVQVGSAVLYRMQDVKTARGRLSPEQAKLVEANALAIIRSEADSQRDIEGVKAALVEAGLTRPALM